MTNHTWETITRHGEPDPYAHTCTTCGTTVPAQLILAAPGTAQTLRDTGRLPAGAELIETELLLGPDTAIVVDPRVLETDCAAARTKPTGSQPPTSPASSAGTPYAQTIGDLLARGVPPHAFGLRDPIATLVRADQVFGQITIT